jgi:hypothetical protein
MNVNQLAEGAWLRTRIDSLTRFKDGQIANSNELQGPKLEEESCEHGLQ